MFYVEVIFAYGHCQLRIFYGLFQQEKPETNISGFLKKW